jgi:hypothetical protein
MWHPHWRFSSRRARANRPRRISWQRASSASGYSSRMPSSMIRQDRSNNRNGLLTLIFGLSVEEFKPEILASSQRHPHLKPDGRLIFAVTNRIIHLRGRYSRRIAIRTTNDLRGVEIVTIVVMAAHFAAVGSLAIRTTWRGHGFLLDNMQSPISYQRRFSDCLGSFADEFHPKPALKTPQGGLASRLTFS